MAEDLDRNEPATPYKLEQARKKGQVSKSTDVVSVAVFAIAVTYLNWKGVSNILSQFRFDQQILLKATAMEAGAGYYIFLFKMIIVESLSLLGPFFFAIMLSAILGNLFQTGPIFSFEPIKPDWNRINPVDGIKRFFSMQTLFSLLRTCLKMLVLIPVMYYALKSIIPQFFHLSSLSALGFINVLIEDIASIGFKMALVLLIIALLDYGFTQRQYAKKMSMSRRDLKDEVKHREGSPRIRSRMNELRRELYQRSMSFSKTSQADVLITNPTHIAVALRYKHGEMDAPQLLSKGRGIMAAMMRGIAAKHNIPIVQNPPLARKLFQDVNYEQYVPQQYYGEVARIIVWLYAMRQARTAHPNPAGK